MRAAPQVDEPAGPMIVAGAGVTGLTVALFLARAAARVTVCDPAPLGDNASGVAAGMLAPAFEAVLDSTARAHFGLLREARDLWPALAEEAGVLIHRSGARARGAPEWLEAVAAGLSAISAEHTATGEEVFTPEDWRLEPAQALAALHGAAQAAGVDFRNRAVTAFTPGEATLENGETLPAARLILATGAARGLAPEQDLLAPIKGHILRYAMNNPGGPATRGDGVYLCPSGQSLVAGATMEAGRADTVIDADRVDGLRRAAGALMPLLSRARALAQAGVRAATADGLPLVGPSSQAGVILAAGLRRNGWLLAPLVARIAAAHALGGDPGPWASAFDPRRFDST